MKWKTILLPIFVVLFLDQLTKILLTNKHYTILGFPIISYTENTGAAFSILQGQRWIFIIIAVIALIILAYYTTRIRSESKNLHMSIGILIGGIIGNLIDRIFLGYVKDFINFKVWPTFNVADVAMFIAIALLIIHFMKRR